MHLVQSSKLQRTQTARALSNNRKHSRKSAPWCSHGARSARGARVMRHSQQAPGAQRGGGKSEMWDVDIDCSSMPCSSTTR